MKILEEANFPNYIYDCRYQILKNSKGEYFLKLLSFYATDFDLFTEELEDIIGVEILEWIEKDKAKELTAKIKLLFPEKAYKIHK